MATYSRLLLSEGGGIQSEMHRATPVENTINLLIGLGGTGIDCLSEIKKSVYDRLKPDDPDAEIPTYDRIRFLAVDDDWYDLKGLNQNEIFDISHPNLRMVTRPKTVSARPEMDWFDAEMESDIGRLGEVRAGGSRPLSRFLFMGKSGSFLAAIKDVISQAQKGEAPLPLYVHIFTGIGGGVGSGTFLDVCYLVKKAIQEANGGRGIVLGYFFLPEVTLAKIPPGAHLTEEYIKKNGYAAMQELDYCMRLPENGGTFTQTYVNGIRIDWNEPPMEFCHLISITDGNLQIHNQPYQYAMSVAAEYVMGFLTKPIYGHADAGPHGDSFINSYLTQIRSRMNDAEQDLFGKHFLTIGASAASIPRREILTYLTAKVFHAFAAVRDRVPTEPEVQAIAHRTRLSDMNALLDELSRNGGGMDLIPLPDEYGMSFARANGDELLLGHYKKQKEEKEYILERNKKIMMDPDNPDSLFRRICTELDDCVRDLSRGPAYAHNAVYGDIECNLIRILDGMIESAYRNLHHSIGMVWEDPGCARRHYEESKARWDAQKNTIIFRARKAFDQYVMDIEALIRGEITVRLFERAIDVLKELRGRLMYQADRYYRQFDCVMRDLIDTFRENEFYLDNEEILNQMAWYEIPIVSVHEIQNQLDDAVASLNLPYVYSFFMEHMLEPGADNKTCWEDGDENKIAKKVSSFFGHDIFGDYEHKSLRNFLFDKYNIHDTALVADHLYYDYMLVLQDRSKANVYTFGGDNYGQSYVSVPYVSDVAVNAAQRVHTVGYIKRSELSDRISFTSCTCGIPGLAHVNENESMWMYYTELGINRHIYNGKGGSELFPDWNKLPPLCPLSYMDSIDRLPDRLRIILDDAQKLYHDAVKWSVIQDHSIMKISTDSIDRLEYEESGYSIPVYDTYNTVKHPILAYFLFAPALHTVVRRELEKLQKYIDKYEALKGELL